MSIIGPKVKVGEYELSEEALKLLAIKEPVQFMSMVMEHGVKEGKTPDKILDDLRRWYPAYKAARESYRPILDRIGYRQNPMQESLDRILLSATTADSINNREESIRRHYEKIIGDMKKDDMKRERGK